MKRTRRWQLTAASLLMLITGAVAVAPFKKVSIATTSATSTTTTTTTTTEASSTEANSDSSSGTTKNSKLTGIPQIDYIWDPNLPRELRGYNLSSYPFFSSVPPEEDIHFKCDGLHDGFYASIEHKCQLYHHCVYGIRHDFLCANFTAFDQRTFICHFVSDVDCEGSKNYWNRNDDLYMATTTTTTTTTTTEPPPTPRRRLVRPLRPLRRPINRRPIDDYYYEEEEDELPPAYDEDYYEEPLNRRRKPKPRQRKPIAEYEEDYSEDKPRRHNPRDRFRDDEEIEDDYDTDRRKYDRPNTRHKPAERRKSGLRKTTAAAARLGDDERRSFADERTQVGRKDKSRITSSADPIDVPARRLTGRRRINEKQRPSTSSTSGDIDDLDDYEKPQGQIPDQEEAAEEEAPPKVKTTPKPAGELITPKAGSGSVYARPRAPPRIARPVPLNEKKKFQYPIQKTGTTPSPEVTHAAEDGDYYEDEAYEDVRPQHPRRRIVDSKLDEDEIVSGSKRRSNHNDTPLPKKPSRTTIRRPTTDKKHAVIAADEEDYDGIGDTPHEPTHTHTNTNSRKRLFANRNRASFGPPVGRGSTDDVDFVDDDYDERPLRPAHRLRPKAAARKGTKKTRRPIEEVEDEDLYVQEPEPLQRNRASAKRPKTGSNARLRQSSTTTTTTTSKPVPIEEDEAVPYAEEDADGYAEAEPEAVAEAEEPSAPAAVSRGSAQTPSGRTATVRVVKRPFLPSRRGSPYLPRGLQPVGVGLKPLGGSAHTTDSTAALDMGSTISGVRLLEHGAPILRDSGNVGSAAAFKSHNSNGYANEREREIQRTTLPPRSALPLVVTQARPEPQPKINLDELYENDYDVTLNDALNPTLKPLSPLLPHHSNHHSNIHNSAFEDAYTSESTGVSTFANNNNNKHKAKSQSQTHFDSQPQNHHHHHLNDNHDNHQRQNEHLLAQQTEQQQQQQQQQHQKQQQTIHNDYNSDDSYFSPTDIRRRAIVASPQAFANRQTAYRGVGFRLAQHFYDESEY